VEHEDKAGLGFSQWDVMNTFQGSITWAIRGAEVGLACGVAW